MTRFVGITCAIFAASCITLTVAADDAPPLFVDLTHKASSTSSISIAWRVNPEYENDVIEYSIEYMKLDSGAHTRSGPLPAKLRSYEVGDLMNNADYSICVVVTKLANDSAVYDSDAPDHRMCDQFFTIPLIRTDSVVVLLVAVGFVLLMVVTGYLSWRCAKARLAKASAEAEEEETSEGNLNAGGYQPIEDSTSERDAFLAPPTSGVIRRPRSTIEDEDIPYITPPWNELGDGESEKRATTNNSK